MIFLGWIDAGAAACATAAACGGRRGRLAAAGAAASLAGAAAARRYYCYSRGKQAEEVSGMELDFYSQLPPATAEDGQENERWSY